MKISDSSHKIKNSPRWVDITQLTEYLPYTRRAIVDLIESDSIPSYKPKGKHLFNLDEIDNWVKTYKSTKNE